MIITSTAEALKPDGQSQICEYLVWQVMRKQKTPQRDVRKKLDENLASSAPDPQPKQQQQPRKQKNQDKPTQESKAKDSRAKDRKCDESQSNKKPERHKNRIAANFGAKP